MPDLLDRGTSLRLLIIGAGKMGRAHARAFRRIPGVEIVGVASRGGESARRLAEEIGAPAWGADWERLADRTRPDAAVVAVAHAATAAVTGACIDRGLHVLAEKPVAFTASAVRELAARAARRPVLAMAAMNRRYYPSVLAAIEAVRYHGEVLAVSAMCPDAVGPYRALGRLAGFVYDHWVVANTIHGIDLLRLAGGEVSEVAGRGMVHAESGERVAAFALSFERGAVGTFTLYAPSGGDWELRVCGDGVEARLSPLERGTLRVAGGPPRPLPPADGPWGLKPGVYGQALAFVEAVTETGILAWPASSLDDHARSVALAERLGECGARRERTD